MNILIICHYGLYRDLTASFVHNQAKAYAALGSRVRVIIPIAFGKPDRRGKRLQTAVRCEKADGVELYYVRYLSLSGYGEHGFNTRSAIAALRPRLPEILDGFRPDVIHAHTLGFDSGIGSWLKKRLGCPLVVTTHGSDTSIPLQQGRSGDLRRACAGADRIAAVSSVLAEKLRSCGTLVPVETILNGFQSRDIPAGNRKAPFSLLQVGHLIPQKKTDVTIRALALLRQKYPDVSLSVIGTGTEREALERLCSDLGIAGKVSFTEFLPNPEVLRKMAETQFFVMPSVREGFGIVYLEAMACGCVTIGTQGEGISDLIVSGKNGILVPPDDPEAIAREIAEYLENPAKMQEIAECGRRDALALTWETNAKQYLDLFGRIVQ
jgi:glycosyltransferase involved in cell wall biosynthesis